MRRFIISLLLLLPFEFIFAQDEVDIVSNSLNLEIHDINFQFTNTQSFKVSELELLIESPKNEFLNLQTLNLDVRRLDKFYFDNGFFDTNIDTNIILLKNNKIDITFIINENEPYYIRNIIYSGLDKVRLDVLNRMNVNSKPFLKTDEIYSKNNLYSEGNRIISFLNDNGYAIANLKEPEVIKMYSYEKNSRKTVDVKINIDADGYYSFGKTTVEIKDNPNGYGIEDILKGLEYKEGDIYSKSKLIESENRISKISILENSRISISDVDSVNKKINLVATANISNKYELQPNVAGYEIQNNFYAGLGLSFTDKYFFGGGRTMGITGSGYLHASDNYILEASANLNQPNLFNNNKITGLWNITGQFLKDGIYKISSFRNSFSLSYELPKYTYINNLNVEWIIKNDKYRINELATLYFGKNDTINLPEFNIDLFSSIIGVTSIHNRTDDFAYPTKGFYQSLLLEESGLLGTVVSNNFDASVFKYIKITNLNKIYLDITKRKTNILAIKLLLGSIFEFSGNTLKISGYSQETNIDIIPIESRFICGGSNSIRGWTAKKLGTFPTSDNGGDLLVEGSFEYRLKPYIEKENFLKDIGFVTFIDYGNLWKRPAEFKMNQIAIAMGFGLRYYTIVGPVRFDIGMRLFDPQAPDNDTEQWLFQNSLNTILKKKIAFQFGIGNTF